MSKPNLGLIITGQLRTFFKQDVFDSFCTWLSVLKGYYTIYVALIINEATVDPGQFNFLKDFCAGSVIYCFDTSAVKPVPQEFLEALKEYPFEANPMKSLCIQKKQIQIGYELLKGFGINISINMKTRFDLFYGYHIIPFTNPHPLFPHSIFTEIIYMDYFRKAGFGTIGEFNEWQIQQKNAGAAPFIDWNITFGAHTHYNTDIFDTNDKLWLYHDFIIIGEPHIFERYLQTDPYSQPEEFRRIINDKKISNPTAGESQNIINMYLANITPIAYASGASLHIRRGEGA